MLRDIKGFENYYSVSDDGKVYSKIRKKYLKLNYKEWICLCFSSSK